MIDDHDIFVCTAQILVDALRGGNIQSLCSFSLIIFDECHHAMKEHPYNKIMFKYLDEKFEQNNRSDLPQVNHESFFKK